MYVKSLTLKGFKSFASATHLRLEPGITCIVGPNGSGKSNVVDALAWVMGEQGAKTLRGGKMEDVIFAGTSGRPPLGRAEVTMTIDNSDGALPIDYTEVTISRTMFRNGGSEYAINGTSCRLLDIQELLSDSGIGREMHVIVGQGQLDAVLRATPEERRGFIEEAAGVLKHRKRKEKALRKLEGMEVNLARLADLTSELRRQLGPLGRQAEAARRAATIQADARDARSRLLADDLVQLTSALEQEVADERALLARRARAEETVAQLQGQTRALDEAARAAAPELAAAGDRWVRLRSLAERLEATAALASDRVRLLTRDDEEESTSGRDPEELRAQAARAREAEQAMLAEVAAVREKVEAAVAAKEEAESAHTRERDRLAALARAAADRREGLARLAGQVGARRSRIEAGEAEAGRLVEAAEAARARASAAEAEFHALEGTIAADESGEGDLDSAYEAAEEAVRAAEAEVERLETERRAVESARGAAAARVEALAMSLRRKDGGAALLELGDDLPGLIGALPTLVDVTGGHEAAVAAALGQAADAVAVADTPSALSALDRLRTDDAGQVTVVVADAPAPAASDRPPLPQGAVWALDMTSARNGVGRVLARVLDLVALVPDAQAAARLVAAEPSVTAVTPDGDVVTAAWVRGGSASPPSQLELTAALEEAEREVAGHAARGEEIGFALVPAREAVTRARARLDAALEALHESDARMSAVAEKLGSLRAAVRTAHAEADRTEKNAAAVRDRLEGDRVELAGLEERLAAAQQEEPEDADDSTDERDRLELEASRARTAETELRLTLRTTEERARSLRGRAESLEGAARNEQAARDRLRARRERRRREAEVARAVHEAAAWGAARIASLVGIADERRQAAQREHDERDAALRQARERLGVAQDELRQLTDSVHADEVARAQQVARIEQLRERAVEELGIDPDVLVDEFGPDRLVPHVPGPDDSEPTEDTPAPEPRPYVREEQEKRLRTAERGLKALGRVNPLALEEFAALEERHTFLVTQLEDLRRSKADLLEIVKEVDERVERVFGEAFADTAEQFERVFGRLFPGGEGRLVLTNPDDLLTTGLEVEARPPGKKVKRLSLLSGGERSLVAVALLVAIFKARPSPFYIMDEVEAALDDTNLGRLITLFEELRDSSQLIVITHQKKTMEVADALYGVSMQGNGITTVVSQRIRDVAPADTGSAPV